MSTVDEIADRYVAEFSVLNPVSATAAGIKGYDHLMTDLSPSGHEAHSSQQNFSLSARKSA